EFGAAGRAGALRAAGVGRVFPFHGGGGFPRGLFVVQFAPGGGPGPFVLARAREADVRARRDGFGVRGLFDLDRGAFDRLGGRGAAGAVVGGRGFGFVVVGRAVGGGRFGRDVHAQARARGEADRLAFEHRFLAAGAAGDFKAARAGGDFPRHRVAVAACRLFVAQFAPFRVPSPPVLGRAGEADVRARRDAFGVRGLFDLDFG